MGNLAAAQLWRTCDDVSDRQTEWGKNSFLQLKIFNDSLWFFSINCFGVIEFQWQSRPILRKLIQKSILMQIRGRPSGGHNKWYAKHTIHNPLLLFTISYYIIHNIFHISHGNCLLLLCRSRGFFSPWWRGGLFACLTLKGNGWRLSMFLGALDWHWPWFEVPASCWC